MSVLTAIFQAIFQAITWILPVSESGHSTIFHQFAGRFSGTCSALTGVIHIGISIGIIFAMFGLFSRMFKEFIGTINDGVHKQLSFKKATPARSFMYMSVIAFVPTLLWLIPFGRGMFLYSLLKSVSTSEKGLVFNGIFLAITGGLVYILNKQISTGKMFKNINVPIALLIGLTSVFLVPMTGLSLIAGVLAVSMLLGLSRKSAIRMSMLLSVPILFVTGIVEICTSVSDTSIFALIVGLIISIPVAFFATKILITIVKNNTLKPFAYYDFAIGGISFIVGIFTLIF